MRCNREELLALALQGAYKFEREGPLLLKERQDTFFRRSEEYTQRWFRLRGNLMYYLEGGQPWHKPLSFIVLGHHDVRILPQDEGGYWPFHITWGPRICYRLAALTEEDRELWLKSVDMGPYQQLSIELEVIRERITRMRPVIDISIFRIQKKITSDINEVPMCEMSLSCDNLLCDANGRPPSTILIVYIKFYQGFCVRYGATEIVENCSNPTFSKTVLFRGSDGLTGDEIVRIVAFDVRERVTDTTVPLGCTAMQLSTIQEAQRLRVALITKDNETVGFLTINGWSLEPSYAGTSPKHNPNCDKTEIDLPYRVLCHRRSQSLPPKLGLKLKYPTFCNLMKINFANCIQSSYRFHSGLGGDIMVHEMMAEPRICYQIPTQLLGLYIRRERELLEELMSVGNICGQWVTRQQELVGIHASLMKLYAFSKKRLRQMVTPFFKASSVKGEATLEFVPVNLHLQRLWVHNDTLNKTSSHDVITAGAFTAHSHKAGRSGGLLELVQQMKEINNSRFAVMESTASKIQADYETVVAMRVIREHILQGLEKMVVMLQCKQGAEIVRYIEEVNVGLRSFIRLWDPNAVEEAVSYLEIQEKPDQTRQDQTMTSVQQSTKRLSLFDTAPEPDISSSESSSASTPAPDSTPTLGLSASVPNVSCPPNCPKAHASSADNNVTNGNFGYFRSNRQIGTCFHSMRSARLTNGTRSLTFDFGHRSGSLDQCYSSSPCLARITYRNSFGSHRRALDEPVVAGQIYMKMRKTNLIFLQSVKRSVEETFHSIYEAVLVALDSKTIDLSDQIDDVRTLIENAKAAMEASVRWTRVAHAAQRLRWETQEWARDQAALQFRRDACFSQALTTLTTGILSWICSEDREIVAKILGGGLSPLCEFEGLLSLSGSEKAMWGDMVVAVEDLHTVQYNIVKTSVTTTPQVTGERGNICVNLPVSETLYSKIRSKSSFTVTVVFFNIGINEKATEAEALGETVPQVQSNKDNLQRMLQYYRKYTKILKERADIAASSSRAKPLEQVMEYMRIAVNRNKAKNVDILHLASLATRLMHGVRFTSCKSAKDRTGMAVTLEQVSILTSEYHLAEHEYKKALDIMRSNGPRFENTYKNIGEHKYAFNKKQVLALPEEYRPPAGTYGCIDT